MDWHGGQLDSRLGNCSLRCSTSGTPDRCFLAVVRENDITQ